MSIYAPLPPYGSDAPEEPPLTAERFMESLWSFVADQNPKNVAALKDCLDELFRRLAT